MGVLFSKDVDSFNTPPAIRIVNKRIALTDYRYLVRADLTFQALGESHGTEYPYLENQRFLKQLLPLPSFLLLPLNRYRLPYETAESGAVHSLAQKTVIYLHGSGSVAEDNSILHRLLLQNGYDLIRISYYIDYNNENIQNPKNADEMMPFLAEIESRIAPVLVDELKSLLTTIKSYYPDLLGNKEVDIVAHSLGGGIAANLISSATSISFDKFINLDGTLMNPAIQEGIVVKQLHLSQDRLFRKEWIKAEDFTDPLRAIGQDYCRKINMLIRHSTNTSMWIQINDASHFTFTDFPNLLKPYGMFKRFAGDRQTAERIRRYVLNFLMDANDIAVDHQDVILTM